MLVEMRYGDNILKDLPVPLFSDYSGSLLLLQIACSCLLLICLYLFSLPNLFTFDLVYICLPTVTLLPI